MVRKKDRPTNTNRHRVNRDGEAVRPIHQQSDKQTFHRSDKQIDRQANAQTDNQTDSQTDIQTVRQAKAQTESRGKAVISCELALSYMLNEGMLKTGCGFEPL